ncbi:MAG: hypothetical protein OYH77_03550 [Pseudomonadota bacterium]|nr:hypothetical protein [Pseudomonadota bacterium]
MSFTAIANAVPDEYRAVGGSNTGLGNAASVGSSGVAAVVLNPAMIALEKTYHVAAGYTWPTSGRNFYQAGIVDGKTSGVSAGVIYTGFHDKFVADSFLYDELDSPIERRGILALSSMFANVAVGISGHYIEGYQFAPAVAGLFGLREAGHAYQDTSFKKVRGLTVGGGVAIALLPTLRLGASVLNLANRKMKDFAPRTLRAGMAYDVIEELSLHLDYEEREATTLFTGTTNNLSQRMLTASASLLVYDMVRLQCAYGHNIRTALGSDGEIAGGLALASDKVSLSYGLKKSLLASDIQHSVNLGFSVAI